nr:VanZ family protein [Tamlana laminarinivorans]
MPNVGFSFADKIFHLVTYAVFMLLWYFTCKFTFNFSRKQSLIYALLFSVVFGIIIEVLQDKLTTTRAFDVFDMVANTAGALLASVFLTFNNKFQVKNN